MKTFVVSGSELEVRRLSTVWSDPLITAGTFARTRCPDTSSQQPSCRAMTMPRIHLSHWVTGSNSLNLTSKVTKRVTSGKKCAFQLSHVCAEPFFYLSIFGACNSFLDSFQMQNFGVSKKNKNNKTHTHTHFLCRALFYLSFLELAIRSSILFKCKILKKK